MHACLFRAQNDAELTMTAARAPVPRVHCDYTTRSGIERLAGLPDEADRLTKTPFAVLQARPPDLHSSFIHFISDDLNAAQMLGVLDVYVSISLKEQRMLCLLQTNWHV